MSAPADFGLPHRIILVRHGQTAHTVADRISGSGFDPEPHLDSEGVAQAQSAARRLNGWATEVDRIITSPLRRARQTAAEISALSGAALAVDPAWAEAHFGAWEGLSVADVVVQFPGAWEAMIGDPLLGPPRGESLTAVRRRVLAAWDELVEPGVTTVVVTHLTPIRILVAQTLAIPHEAFGRVMARPGSLTVIDRWTDQGAMVVTVGER